MTLERFCGYIIIIVVVTIDRATVYCLKGDSWRKERILVKKGSEIVRRRKSKSKVKIKILTY